MDAWQLAVWSFPRDRKLPGLAALGEADARRRLLQDILPAMPELWPAGCRHRLVRRRVGAARGMGGRVTDGTDGTLVMIQGGGVSKSATKAPRVGISGERRRGISTILFRRSGSIGAFVADLDNWRRRGPCGEGGRPPR